MHRRPSSVVVVVVVVVVVHTFQTSSLLKRLGQSKPNFMWSILRMRDPQMTLTYFTARSTYDAHAFEWGKLLKCDLKGKTCKKWINGRNIYVFEKNKCPLGVVRPCPGAINMFTTIIFKHLLCNRLANQSQTLCGALLGTGYESLYKWSRSRSHDQNGRNGYNSKNL